MESRLLVLRLFADELGQSSEIKTLDDRKAFQKAVYLGQLSGVDLGYRYGWYIRGPYSTELARDYYRLAEQVELGDEEFKQRALTDTVKKKLDSIKELFVVPTGLPLQRPSWLEIVASWHFLRTVSKMDDAAARALIAEKKPHLVQYIDNAIEALSKFGLLAGANA